MISLKINPTDQVILRTNKPTLPCLVVTFKDQSVFLLFLLLVYVYTHYCHTVRLQNVKSQNILLMLNKYQLVQVKHLGVRLPAVPHLTKTRVCQTNTSCHDMTRCRKKNMTSCITPHLI